MRKGLQVGIFGGLFLLALIAVILSAVLYPTQWGLFVLLPYFLLPVTAAACASLGDDEEMSLWNNFGCFLESFFWVSSFAVPVLLYRLDAITNSQLWWLIVADLLVLSSFIGLAWVNAG
ncbi:TPA: hypothetical protein N0F65_011310 [Lagenidium giganteum]|uniref:Vacuolar protein sorting 55 n=1 Tax=Lagenidium giganteum TaxID=4803 RepID=A0AAV2YDQ0_9STRA|nr:TPA: hypothetical protein N0F65_011310 [Lagenidium giganteum]